MAAKIVGDKASRRGATMAPRYTDEDYTGGDPDELIAAYPKREALVEALTRRESDA